MTLLAIKKKILKNSATNNPLSYNTCAIFDDGSKGYTLGCL